MRIVSLRRAKATHPTVSMSPTSNNDKIESAGEMMGRLAAISDQQERLAALRQCYDRIDTAAVQLLSSKASEGDASWVDLLRDLQVYSFSHPSVVAANDCVSIIESRDKVMERDKW